MPLTLLGYLRDVNWRDLLSGRESLSGTVREWRRDRDVDAISGALQSLSERQLNLIGMSHFALAGDVHRLVERVERDRAYAPQGLPKTLVIEGRSRPAEALPSHGASAGGRASRRAETARLIPWTDAGHPHGEGRRRADEVRLAA